MTYSKQSAQNEQQICFGKLFFALNFVVDGQLEGVVMVASVGIELYGSRTHFHS